MVSQNDEKRSAYTAWQTAMEGGAPYRGLREIFLGQISLFENFLFRLATTLPGHYGGELARQIVLAIIFGDIDGLPSLIRKTRGHRSGPGSDGDWNDNDSFQLRKWNILAAAGKAAMMFHDFKEVFRSLVCHSHAAEQFAEREWKWDERLNAVFILRPDRLAVDVHQLAGYSARFSLGGKLLYWLNERADGIPEINLQPDLLYCRLASENPDWRKVFSSESPFCAWSNNYAPVNPTPYRTNEFWGASEHNRSQRFQEVFGQRPLLVAAEQCRVLVGLSDGTFRIFQPAENGWLEKYCGRDGCDESRVGNYWEPEKVFDSKQEVANHLLALHPAVEQRWGKALTQWVNA